MVESAAFLGIEVQVGPELWAMLMIFARITGLLHTAPIIGTKAVPIPARVGLGKVLTLIVAPLTVADPSIMAWSEIQLGMRMASELLLGLGMGFAASVVLSLLDMAGTFIGVNAQLAIAVQFDPLTNTQQVVTTRLIQAAGLLTFLALDLHHLVLVAMVDSFTLSPPGHGALALVAGPQMSAVLGTMLVDAMRISMPVVAAVLVLNIVAALVTRFAQQMNIYFSVGLPANAAAGLLAAALAVPALVAAVAGHGSGIRELMLRMVGS